MTTLFSPDFKTVSDRLTRTLSALDAMAAGIGDSVPITVAGPVRRSVASLSTLWADTEADLRALVTTIPTMANEPGRTDAFKVDAIRDRIAATSGSVTSRLTAARTAAGALMGDLEAKLLPTRPTADDGAAQEAAIAGRKADYRMVLDTCGNGDEIVAEAARLLDEAVAAGDELGAWVLSSSGWVDLYLRSRGAEEHAVRWRLDSVPTALRSGDDASRSLSRILEHLQGPYGLVVAVSLMSELARSVLDDLQPERLVTSSPW